MQFSFQLAKRDRRVAVLDVVQRPTEQVAQIGGRADRRLAILAAAFLESTEYFPHAGGNVGVRFVVGVRVRGQPGGAGDVVDHFAGP